MSGINNCGFARSGYEPLQDQLRSARKPGEVISQSGSAVDPAHAKSLPADIWLGDDRKLDPSVAQAAQCPIEIAACGGAAAAGDDDKIRDPMPFGGGHVE